MSTWLIVITIVAGVVLLGFLAAEFIDWAFEVYWKLWRKRQKYKQQRKNRRQFERSQKYRKHL